MNGKPPNSLLSLLLVLSSFSDEELSKLYPCVKCGYCCRKRACFFGEWDPDKEQCKYLTEDNLCSRYNELINEPLAITSPAFGAGCSSPLFNDIRAKKIIKDKEKE